MKLLIFCCLLIADYAPAQSVVNYVLLGKDYKITDNPNRAVYIVAIKKYNDSSFERLEYNFAGPKLRSNFYKDPDMKIKHGKSFLYDDSGHVFLKGMYVDNKRSGYWYDNRLKKELLYENDSLLSSTPYRVQKATLDSNRPNKMEIESQYPGGISAYNKFLNKYMQYPERALKMETHGTVVIQFTVESDGSLSDIEVSSSVEISLDEEAMRLFYMMPKWIPAIQDGNKVKSYKKQPITFALTRQ